MLHKLLKHGVRHRTNVPPGQRCFDDYNAGIRAANEQKFADARTAFEKVIAGCAATDAALVARAQETLEEIKKFEKKRKS